MRPQEAIAQLESMQRETNTRSKDIEAIGLAIKALKRSMNMALAGNRMAADIDETINAIRNCGENSDCEDCYLRLGEDDCCFGYIG